MNRLDTGYFRFRYRTYTGIGREMGTDIQSTRCSRNLTKDKYNYVSHFERLHTHFHTHFLNRSVLKNIKYTACIRFFVLVKGTT